MTRAEAIKILSNRDGHGIPSGYNGGYAEAIDLAIEALKVEPNVFVFSASIFGPADYLEKTRQIIKSQIEQGVVILPSYLTLEAVTGPCTDVEVIIKQEEQP